jgi:hypothetical protein
VSAQFVRSGDNTKTYIFSQVVELEDTNQIVYQDESYPLDVCAEITYTGSNPVLTTNLKKLKLWGIFGIGL